MTLVKYRATLTQYLIEQRRTHPEATGEFNELILAVAQACKVIARAVAHGALSGVADDLDNINVQGEDQKALDVIANDAFLSATEWEGVLSGWASEEMEVPLAVPAEYPRGKYLLVFDPLDGSSNIEVNVSVGSIFSILRSPNPGADPVEADFLQPGTEQVAAGYAIYGPSTMLVLTVGDGVVGFTLDPVIGDFLLTHPDIRVPKTTHEFAINTSNSRFWEAPVKRYVEECLAGSTGPRGRQSRAPAPALRVQPDRLDRRAGGWPCEYWRGARSRRGPDVASPAHRLRVRLVLRGRDRRGLLRHDAARHRQRHPALQRPRPVPPAGLARRPSE